MTTAESTAHSAALAPLPDMQTTPPGRTFPRPRIFAHRGASAAYPEHTRAAYAAALEMDADGIEIDVHLTRDGEVVCFHDPTLDRTTDGRGAVADHALAQLRRLDVHSWHSRSLPARYGDPEDQLMTLQDVVNLLISGGRDIALAIELKHPSPFGRALEEAVLARLLEAGWDPKTSSIRIAGSSGRPAARISVSFMSFSAGALLHLAELVPPEALCAVFTTQPGDQGITTSKGISPHTGPLARLRSAVRSGASRDAQALVWNGQAGIAAPGMDFVRKHRAEISAWISRGIPVRVWTADAPEDLRALCRLGVPQIVTNEPGRAREIVTEG